MSPLSNTPLGCSIILILCFPFVNIVFFITLYFIQIGLCILGLYGVIQREAKEIRFPGILVMLIFLSYPSICYAIPVGNSIFFVVVLFLFGGGGVWFFVCFVFSAFH